MTLSTQQLSESWHNWPVAAKRQMLHRLATRNNPNSDDRLQRWLQGVSPQFNWTWPHVVYVRQQLDAVTNGTLKKLMIFMPPRHGKSELASIRYPAFRLELEPLRVIVGAYNQTLADK